MGLVKLKGKLRISCPICSDGSELIELSLRDELSGVHPVEIKLSYDDFVRAAMGHREVECDYELFISDKIGKKMEVKTEYIDKPEDWWQREKSRPKVEKMIKKLEKDGWEADIETVYQSLQDGPKLHVIFRRWV